MVARKEGEFPARDRKLANYADALGHPARIAILRLLLKHQSLIGLELVERLPLSQATVSRHLQKLAAVGLIKATQEGVRTNFSIDRKAVASFQSLLAELGEE